MNKRIEKLFKNTQNLDYDAACAYVLCLFHGYRTHFIPNEVVRRVNILKIFRLEDNKLKWLIQPFPMSDVTDDDLQEIVEHMLDTFAQLNKDRRGDRKSLTTRLKAWCAENTEYSKEQILVAINAYIISVVNPQYLKKSHKFIYEGSGAMKTSMLSSWVEKTSQDNKDFDHITASW
jgi:hypothetical protein